MKKSAFVLLAGILLTFSLAQQKTNEIASAAYVHGALHVSLPWNAPRSGEGKLTVEVLDPEDNVIAHTDKTVFVSAGRGFSDSSVPIERHLPIDDLVWHRLRYRFVYDNDRTAALDGVTSLSRILRTPVVRVFAQQSYLSGSVAAVRVIVTEKEADTPVASGSLDIQLVSEGGASLTLYKGKLDERGTTRADFQFPQGHSGKFSLRYLVETAVGEAEYTQPIQLEQKAGILLTTEKPVYQPGQTIHVRALALDRANHEATAGSKLTFELEDSRGNKVFRKITQTDGYGVASAEFTLADEVNLGTYHLRCLLAGGASTAGESQIALEIERYVLPKFKVDLDLADKDKKAKRGYRPGDHVTGTIRANYFFGKSVDHAEVEIKASSRDVAQFEIAQSKGITDDKGDLRFDITLPNFLAGHPSQQGAALVMLEATVRDASNHSETRAQTVAVSESPLLIKAIPESGALVPALENQVFLIASYPDGTPAQADLRVRTANLDRAVKTDAAGVGAIQIAGDTAARELRIDARDNEGNQASTKVPLDWRLGSDQLLLRSDQALYRAGDRIRLHVLSTKQRGSAYLDLVKNGQTIGTHDLDIVNGQANLDLTATPTMAGTVEFHAYVLDHNAQPIGDHRLVFVQPADELKIETTVDSPVYKPGSEARIGFHVTNQKGEGVQAALGVEVVDQAVFALAEKQPGFARAFFYLEQEVMKPRYEIHSVGLPEMISSSEPAVLAQRDRAAQALFAATETVSLKNASVEFGRDVPRGRYAAYTARYQKQVARQIGEFEYMLDAGDARGKDTCNRVAVMNDLAAARMVDPWGNAFRVDQPTWNLHFLSVRSAGPDGVFYNGDDIVQNLAGTRCQVAGYGYGGSLDLKVEPHHDAGDRRIAVSGSVIDESGAAIPQASIELFEKSSGRTHMVMSDRAGAFRLASLPAGSYRIRVSASGFRINEREVSLEEGDVVSISATLDVGSVSETVTVTAEASVLKTESGMVMRMMAPRSMAKAAFTDKLAPAQPAPAPIAADAHVRSWFPESLYVAPEIITDAKGRATIAIPIADSITTWRMALLASTKQGALGTGSASLKVFQDFFTEMDLPVTLTQGDQVSLPVAIYNYSGLRGNVRLQLDRSDWFSLDGDAQEQRVAVESERVGSSQFTITAKRIGKFKLTLRAEMEGGARRADIVVREIEVVPNGREQSLVFNGRLDSTARQNVDFPANSIPDASTVFVRLYPGPLSQIVEGMDRLLQMPGGCFEQTSSSTYPNVLALDYMKRTKKVTPEISVRAETYIANGYQRLLTFEVHGGGFSWFGKAPANKILTAYGLMEFSDMSKVHDVDRRVIERTQQWLADQQQPDGSWKPDASFINEGATNRFNKDLLRITAYIAWSLQVSGYKGPAVEHAVRFIEGHLNGDANRDAYTLAVLANFATDYSKDRSFTEQTTRLLLDARAEKSDQAWWNSEETSMYGTGPSAAIETTGLAVQALVKQGNNPTVATKAMNYIVAKKDANGAWGTTQATIMALRALLLASEKTSGTAKGAVEIVMNGKTTATLKLTPENNDLLHQFVLKGGDVQSSNAVEIRFHGEGSFAYQVAGRYFVPWTDRPKNEALSIDVHYDRTRLAQDQVATATATVHNNLGKAANMVMIDLGIPPGFELMSEDLDTYKEKSAAQKSGRLEKFSLTGTQAILYFDSIGPNGRLNISFRLRAKYPIRARSFASKVYEYYAPEIAAVAAPMQLEVMGKR